MSSTSAAAWKTFRDELTQCFVYAHSYKKPELLEGRLVVDLARRLPNFAKQRFLDYLNDRCGSTCDPTFGNLIEFIKREEDSKSSDFSMQLMTDEKSERVTKYNDKSSVFSAVKFNPIQTGRFGNFVRLGGLNVSALFVCLYLSNF